MILTALHIASGAALHAQLRPLEPMHWEIFQRSAPLEAYARVALFDGQRASLAGVQGRLVELGEVRLLVRTGRVVFEFAGTPQRFFADDRRFAPPTGGARPAPPDGERHDSGDYRVATIVRLNSLAKPVQAALRFGTRLPTTDNRVGLDRDQLDFFALLGAQHRTRHVRASAELGLGINGTRVDTYEQSDVLLYAATLVYATRHLTPMLSIVGQDDLAERRIRGNEDLSELRAGLRAGSRRYLEVVFVRGLREFSPRNGVWLGGGVAFNGW